jgi:hypothetical protein
MLKFNSKFLIPIAIFAIFFAYRLPGLAFTFINNDDHHWKTRGYAFSLAIAELNLEGTAPTYHPGVTLLWSQFFAIKSYGLLVDYGYDPDFFGLSEYMLMHYTQHIFILIFTSIIAFFLYKGIEIVAGRKLAILFLLILIGEAFFTAFARTIHLDVLLSILLYCSILFGFLAFRILEQNEKIKVNRHMLLSGFFGGLALLTKSSALIYAPMVFFIGGFNYYFASKNDALRNNLIKKSLLILLFALITFVVFWPAMWVDPVNVIRSYIFDGIKGIGIDSGHDHYWFGEKTQNPGVLFYPLAILARFSAVVCLTFFAGIFIFFKNKQYKSVKIFDQFLSVNLIFLTFYLVMISIAAKKMDRYALPLLFPMILFSLNFIRGLFMFDSGSKFLSVMKVELPFSIIKFFVFLFLYSVSIFAIFYGIHPNYLAYYSPLVGGYDIGRDLIEPKWLVGYDKVAEFFNSKEDPGKIKVAIADLDYIKPMAKFQIIDINDDLKVLQADYLVLPIYREDKLGAYKSKYELKKSDEKIKVAGITYYEIFKLNSEKNDQ